MIFFTLVPAFGFLAGAYLQLPQGRAALATRLLEAAGAFAFVTCICGWYIFFAIMLASVDFPLDLPRKCSAYACTFNLLISFAVVDLSQYVRGASERRKNSDDA